MKITHMALGAILLLAVVAGYLMMDSANDKRMAELQNQMKRMGEMIQKQRQAPAAVSAPEIVAVAPAPADGAVAVAPKSTPRTASVEASSKALTEIEITLPNPADDLKLAPGEKALLMAAHAKQEEELRPTTRAYNPLQVKIKSLPAIAKVRSYNADYSFVELDAGKNKSLEKGMAFDIRRDAMIVGKAIIGDTIEDALSIADVDPKTIPVGVVLQPGDEIVQLN